ncbi:esterase/lipase family protein [Cryptosporangium aurantiacum]|uniref:Lipase (Class 2) n=1 Tax=Cryptosporangium aurantiacum TaxID=134849 RepID=A0A1M7MY65_9ACTN|nr:alpha/beta fold hydrolase [Cryptosporangium aurantiacum]SHM96040.1 Lipase (class 2) [Cryptosporangium aurantiacum]
MRRKLLGSMIAALGATATLLAGAQPTQAAPLPVNYNWLAEFLPNIGNYQQAPPGAITVSRNADGKLPAKCTSSQHPVPVLLAHGTWENQNDNWRALSPYLKNAGYCVYTFNYGGDDNAAFQGTDAVPSNAKELARVVDKVLQVTGAPKVDIVGHSQGGMMPRWYIKFLNGGSKINKLIGLSPSNHGTTLWGLGNLGKAIGLGSTVTENGGVVDGAFDQIEGSAVQQKLATCSTGPAQDVCVNDTVKYTVIQTNGDQVVTPPQNAFLIATDAQKASKQITNILLQDVCILDASEHLAITYDSVAFQLILNALDPSTAKQPVCKLITPYVGG